MNAATTSEPLWEPRRSLTLAAANRHTRFVAILRMAFILGAGCILGLLAFYMASGVGGPGPVDTGPGGESVRMTNPQYTGLDGQGVPYALTAEYATRDMENPDAVKLIKPVLTFRRDSGAPTSSVTALEGLYDSKAQIMELRADVKVRTDDGYSCDTTHAKIFTADRRVTGDEPIRCTGNFGTVEGQRYQIIEDYSRYIFEDNVKAIIYPEDLRRRPVPDAGDDADPETEN